MKAGLELIRDLLDYDPDTGVFRWKVRVSQRVKTGAKAGSFANGYRYIEIKGHNYRAARIAWLLMAGDWPEHHVDHINRIKNDDRWVNLRQATRSENLMNTGLSRANTSGVKNVCFHRRSGKWRVQVGKSGKKFSQDFKTFEAAVVAAEALPNRIFMGGEPWTPR